VILQGETILEVLVGRPNLFEIYTFNTGDEGRKGLRGHALRDRTVRGNQYNLSQKRIRLTTNGGKKERGGNQLWPGRGWNFRSLGGPTHRLGEKRTLKNQRSMSTVKRGGRTSISPEIFIL